MVYLAGVDGGGTKTHCVIGDMAGNILAEGLAGSSNYQIIGKAAAAEAIKDALGQALLKLNLSAAALQYTVLGLSGADREEDFRILNGICDRIFKHGRFQILNDSWIGLRAGIPENWGIVTVCGTGAACSGRTRDGRELTLRNLSYEAGNRGGGLEIVREAFHFAFRSEEKTGAKTRLEEELPKLFGCGNMDDLVEPVCSLEHDSSKSYQIPILVCQLASEGDGVCQDILINMGRSLGEIAGGVIRRLGMADQEFPVTLVGSVFQGNSPLLADEYTTTVHRVAPRAGIGIAGLKPVMGAYFLALEQYRASGKML